MHANIALRSPWRIPAAAAAVVTAAIHLSQFTSTWQENALVGAGFIAFAVACGVSAAVLLARDTPLTWLLLAAVCLADTAGYAVSRTIGLPGMAGDIGNWGEPAGLAAIACQFLVAVAAAITLWRATARVLARPGRAADQRG